MKNYNLKIITPTETKFDSEVNNIIVPGKEGKFGVYYNHIPFLAIIESGELKVDYEEKKPDFIAIHNGFVEVLPEEVIIVVDKAEIATEIDLKWAKRNKDSVESKLKAKTLSNDEKEKYQRKLRRAKSRISIVNNLIE